jgi:hypothetical protein
MGLIAGLGMEAKALQAAGEWIRHQMSQCMTLQAAEKGLHLAKIPEGHAAGGERGGGKSLSFRQNWREASLKG